MVKAAFTVSSEALEDLIISGEALQDLIISGEADYQEFHHQW